MFLDPNARLEASRLGVAPAGPLRLVVSNVYKNFNGCVALRDASLRLHEGEILGLLGPNGSGKSTIIKILSTLIIKDAGKIEIMGWDLDSQDAEIRRLFGYVGQDSDHSAYARLTIRENLEFFGALRGLNRREITLRIDELAHYFEFDVNLDRLFMTLSGGQKQTAIIMRALLSNPPLLYLDEPTRGLDPLVARRIRSFLRHYVTEKHNSVLLTSHILSEVDELADSVALIHKGVVSAIDTPRQMKNSLGVQGLFEVPTGALSRAAEVEITEEGGARTLDLGASGWISFGVPNGPSSLERILGILRRHGVQSTFRYRPITLEDAFVYRVGTLTDRFDV